MNRTIEVLGPARGPRMRGVSRLCAYNPIMVAEMTSQPFFIPAVIFAALSVPLVLGLVPPNRFFGVRTRRTLSSPDLWRRTNRVAGWAVLAASAVYLEVARARPYIRTAPDDLRVWLVHLAAFAGPLVAALYVAARYAKKPV
jgi:SdpI/YfhL protein family